MSELIDPFRDAYVVLTDADGNELGERHPVNVYLTVGQPASPYAAGTVEFHVDRTIELTYTPDRQMSVAATISTPFTGPIIEVRRVHCQRGWTANLTVQQTNARRREMREHGIAKLEHELGIGAA